MTRFKRMYRPAALFLAAFVATTTVAVLVNATQTITTPNASSIGYSLAPGANSAPITPPANVSVLVMGVQTALGYRGTGHVTLLHVPGSFLEWVGLESPDFAAITSGFSGAAGTHIVYISWNKEVDLQVASPDTFKIHNANTITMTGNVTMIW